MTGKRALLILRFGTSAFLFTICNILIDAYPETALSVRLLTFFLLVVTMVAAALATAKGK